MKVSLVWPLARLSLVTKSLESPALPLEAEDHVPGSHGLPPGVLGVGHGVTDEVLQEDLEEGLDQIGAVAGDKTTYPEDFPGLLVDEAGDLVDSSTTSQPPDGGLGDALDGDTEDHSVP